MNVPEFCERYSIPLDYYEYNQEYYLRADTSNSGIQNVDPYLELVIRTQYPNAVFVPDKVWTVYRLGTVFDLIQNPGKTIVTAAERLRASLPNLIASEIVGVQPMDCTLGAVSTLITQNSKDNNADQGATHDQ